MAGQSSRALGSSTLQFERVLIEGKIVKEVWRIPKGPHGGKQFICGYYKVIGSALSP